MEIAAALFGLLVGGFLAAVSTHGIMNERWETEAIKAGVAYYACTPDTGKCTFTWKTPQP